MRFSHYIWQQWLNINIAGRSNAITIAERLGLPHIVAENAREQYGSASAEINGVKLLDFHAYSSF